MMLPRSQVLGSFPGGDPPCISTAANSWMTAHSEVSRFAFVGANMPQKNREF